MICFSRQVIPSDSALTKEPTEEEKKRLAHIGKNDIILRPSARIQMEEEAKRREREKEANALINHYAQIMSAGVSALFERAFVHESVPPSWGTLTKDELPKKIAEGMRLYEDEKDRRENIWSRRLQRYAKAFLVVIATAVIGVLVGWYMAMHGFR